MNNIKVKDNTDGQESQYRPNILGFREFTWSRYVRVKARRVGILARNYAYPYASFFYFSAQYSAIIRVNDLGRNR